MVVRYGRPLPEVATSIRGLACAAAADVADDLADAAVDIHFTDLTVGGNSS